MAFHSILLYFLTLVAYSQAKCNADNCYRAMFPCQSGLENAWSTASNFCATSTAHSTTASDYPTRATDHCGLTANSYLSVCSCGPTCTPRPTCTSTPRPPGAFLYNDFECVLPTVEVLDLAVWLENPGEFDDHPFAIWAHFRDIRITKHRLARLTFDVKFLHADAGGIRIIAEDIFRQYVTAPLESPTWSTVAVEFTPRTHTASFSIGFNFGSQNAHNKIDNILLQYVEQTP
ncbi:hypothetical protein G7046_g5121 [Stylonectria norvegica]|nr:hypothetical protein G7046_g5121 [Stylonectria norvegica]